MIKEAQPTVPTAGPMASVIAAMNAGLNIEEAKGLLAEQKAWEEGETRKAFACSMAEFKLNPPEILKDKTGFLPDGEGGFESYDYATIGNVCEQIIKAAARHGFSHRWIPDRGPNGELVVTCEVTHRSGHAQQTRLDSKREDRPDLTVAQSEQSVRTFLQRYSLLMAYGFAAKEQPDDDGHGGAGLQPPAEDSVVQGWIIYANNADTLEKLSAVRREAATAFDNASDVNGWGRVKAALDARLAALQGGAS